MLFFIVLAVFIGGLVLWGMYDSYGYLDWTSWLFSIVVGSAVATFFTLAAVGITFDVAPSHGVTKSHELHPIYENSKVVVEAKKEQFEINVDGGLVAIDAEGTTILSTKGEIKPKIVFTENYINNNWWTRFLGIAGKVKDTSSVLYLDSDTLVYNKPEKNSSAPDLKIK
ncbi:hypothetical protein [Enterococcus phage vB_Efs25_KEN11]|uniref:Uncharacterized protein n=1 Tax=Enterococcus phage vB_Efs6_KEN16 TaxID=3138325 RepID=A0AAX4PTL7_9CAUD